MINQCPLKPSAHSTILALIFQSTTNFAQCRHNNIAFIINDLPCHTKQLLRAAKIKLNMTQFLSEQSIEFGFLFVCVSFYFLLNLYSLHSFLYHQSPEFGLLSMEFMCTFFLVHEGLSWLLQIAALCKIKLEGGL